MGVDYCVIAYSDELYSEAAIIASKIRAKGKTVTLYSQYGKKIKDAFAYANHIRAIRTVFIAPDEFSAGNMTIKDMRSTGKNKGETINIAEYIDSL